MTKDGKFKTLRAKTYYFTFYSRRRYWRSQCVTRRFRNAAEASLFADGLQRGGAWDVKISTDY